MASRLARDGSENAHAGDMGNIEVKEDGSASYKAFIPGLSVSEGERSIAGRAVILHIQQDDYGQPTGNAGARIGCGTIVIKSE